MLPLLASLALSYTIEIQFLNTVVNSNDIVDRNFGSPADAARWISESSAISYPSALSLAQRSKFTSLSKIKGNTFIANPLEGNQFQRRFNYKSHVIAVRSNGNGINVRVKEVDVSTEIQLKAVGIPRHSRIATLYRPVQLTADRLYKIYEYFDAQSRNAVQEAVRII